MKPSINQWRRALVRRLFGERFSANLYGRKLAARLQSGGSPGQQGNATLEAAQTLVSTGEVVVDVGALGGDWSFALGHKVGTSGMVLGIEANPFFASVLGAAFRRLAMPQVQIVNAALGARAGQAWLATKSDIGQELLGFAHIASAQSINTVSVPMTTLDALARTHPRLLQTRLLKMDTEGYEPLILQGALEFLARVRPILICEVNSAWLNRLGWTPSRLHALLSEQGYEPVAANGKEMAVVELEEWFSSQVPFSDDIMFRHRRA
jgi:FkbM family methyltransferase